MAGSEFDGFGGSASQISAQAPEFVDRAIACIDCSKDFTWTVGEQIFFRDKQLQNPPKRCKECKQAKNERLAAIALAQASGVRQRIEVSVNCAKCGAGTTVPFYPSQGRPVYCRSCFLEMNPHILNGAQTQAE
jgi:CxxC-x17-CxxC domain-containing protein